MGQTSWFLSSSNAIYVSGNNEYGQLGIGSYAHQNVPQLFTSPSGKQVINLSSGCRHTAIITEDGKLYSFGHNDQQQCGVRGQDKLSSPTLVPSSVRFVMVSCGNAHTLALSEDGKVYAFGGNAFGQLGVSRPQGLSAVEIDERVVSISAGNDHSAALSESGQVYTWGCGTSGQLGLDHSDNVQFPEKLSSISDKVTKVSCGYMHTAVLTEKGDVHVFGFLNNELKFGQTGKKVGSFPSDKVKTLASGSTHILVLTYSGKVYGIGVNGHGQLASTEKILTQLQEIAPLQGKKINQVATGFQHSLALTNSGQVLAFGRNERGQLGVGHSKLQTTPAQLKIPNVSTLVDIFQMSQLQPLRASSNIEEITETLPLPVPSTVYHEQYNLDLSQQAPLQTESIETELPLPQFFKINKK
uniref:RCC1-like domain-containing protein n=1 Tax=Arcella intermedia TaxID=1963864 RepID=A0A6B2L5F4_9EUKA